MCRGGSSFNELWFLKDIKLNNGLVLVNGYISYAWLNVQFWRTFFSITLHFLSILFTHALSLKLGIFTNIETETQMENIIERPSEDSITAYSFVKQQFYYKVLAATNYEKGKDKRKKQKCPEFC
jgi:hypothetical protein